MRRTLLLSIVAAVALASLLLADGGKDSKGLKDSGLSLARTSVFEVAVPPAVEADAPEAGESTPQARAYPEMPPVVPHAISEYLPITRADNACIDCHAVEERAEGEPIPLPPSHFVDLRNAPEKVGSRLAGARYVCTSCHVARTAAPPLVANPFHTVPPAAVAGDAPADESTGEARPPDS